MYKNRMKKTIFSSFSSMLGVGLGLVAVLVVVEIEPVWAHHSFAAEFDASKTVTLSGAVTKVGAPTR